MVFDIHGKVALVTGGASGIGLQFVKELLRSGVKGVTVADLNADLVETTLAEVQKEFGPNRIIFVKTDVTDIQQFENAFKKTVETFKHVDILINNAGICKEKTWQKEIAVNINGMVHGILLGLEDYLPKYKQGQEAVIVNISSISALGVFPCLPIYSGTKAAMVQMTRVWGDTYHYERTKVRLFAICPGLTSTPLAAAIKGTTLGSVYDEWMDINFGKFTLQEPEDVAQEATKLIQSSPSGAVWVIEGAQPAYQYIFPDRETIPK